MKRNFCDERSAQYPQLKILQYLVSVLLFSPLAINLAFAEESLRVGVVYRDAPEGERMVVGIMEAIDAYNQQEGVRKAKPVKFSYPHEQAGLRVIRGCTSIW